MRIAAPAVGLILAALLVGGVIAVAQRSTASARPLVAARTVHAEAALQDRGEDPPHNLVGPTPSPSSKPPVVASTGSPTVRSTQPSIVVRSEQQALINRDRAAHGLGPLTWNGCLYNVAIANARRIAAEHVSLGYISHTNGPQADLSCGLGGRAGENIGDWSLGINDVQLNNMFMASPDHRANILGPYHYVATAWVVGADGWGYIAVEFS